MYPCCMMPSNDQCYNNSFKIKIGKSNSLLWVSYVIFNRYTRSQYCKVPRKWKFFTHAILWSHRTNSPEQSFYTAAHKDLKVVNVLPVTIHYISANDSSDFNAVTLSNSSELETWVSVTRCSPVVLGIDSPLCCTFFPRCDHKIILTDSWSAC